MSSEIKKYGKNRVNVFVDASNIYFSQKKIKWQIDFEKFLQYFKTEFNLKTIFYYTARDKSSLKQNKFLLFMEKTGYVIRSKNIKFIKNKQDGKDGFYKGNLDVELTIDVLETKDQYDTLILVSGDSDFEPLLELMKVKYNKKCLVMSAKHSISIELIKCARFINIGKLRKYLEKSINPGV